MPESSEPGERSLLKLWRAGDEDAARALFDAYVERLVALARRRLTQRLAGRVDPEDIVQSVFRTFFGRVKAGEFRIEEQDDLCKLLMRITVHKTLRQVAHHMADKRDPRHESSTNDQASERMRELLDKEPTPDAAVAFIDQLEHFLAQLRPEERQILELRLQGFSNEEIVQKMDLKYDRKVRRVIARIRDMAEMEGLLPAPEAGT